MNRLEQLDDHERRLTAIEEKLANQPAASSSPAKKDKASRSDSLPRKVLPKAGTLLVIAFKQLMGEDHLSVTLTMVTDRARSLEGGEVVPAKVPSHTLQALLAEHEGLAVQWCNTKPTLESVATSDDPRAVARHRG